MMIIIQGWKSQNYMWCHRAFFGALELYHIILFGWSNRNGMMWVPGIRVMCVVITTRTYDIRGTMEIFGLYI